MKRNQALMIYAFLGHLSEMRRAVHSHGHGSVKPAGVTAHTPHAAMEVLRGAADRMGMTHDNLCALIDRYDAEMAKAHETVGGGLTAGEMYDVVYTVTGDGYDMDPIGIIVPDDAEAM